MTGGPALTLDQRIAAHLVADLAQRHQWAQDRVRQSVGVSAIGVPYAPEVVAQVRGEADQIQAALVAALAADDQRPELMRIEVEALTAESRRHREQRDDARSERDRAIADGARLRNAITQAVTDLSATMTPTAIVRAADKVLGDLRRPLEG